MTKYTWIMPSNAKDSFIDSLKDLGVVDMERSDKPVDDHSAGLLSSIGQLRDTISMIEKGEDRQTAALDTEIAELARQMDAVEVWGDFNSEDISRLEDNGIHLNFFCVDDKSFDPGWEQTYPLEIIGHKSRKTFFVIAGDVPHFPLKPQGVPSASVKEYEERIAALKQKAEAHRKELSDRKAEIPSLNSQCEALTVELDTYLASLTSESSVENHIAVYTGFAPHEEDTRLKEFFDSQDLYYYTEEACAQDKPPIKLKNNRFVKMFEVLTDMYGRPAYDSFDPTPFISVFFLLFFAMCMGDMGYGLVLVIAGLLLKKVSSFSSLAPLVTCLGVGTIAVGFCFHTFFSIDFMNSAWVPGWARSIMVPAKIAGYDGAMIIALAIGIIHLCLAMIVKTVNATRNKGFIESLGTWGWTLLIVGGVAVGAAALAGVLDRTVTKIVLIALGILCAIGIYPLNNIHRKPLANVGSGLWDTYNMATGLLGDVLSYLRLYALGLAGAMLGYAFNDMAEMALGDGGIGRWVAFILIVVIGHTLNLAMAALGAFVHPLRLNFLEFFKNSDYDASGRNYRPLSNSNNNIKQ